MLLYHGMVEGVVHCVVQRGVVQDQRVGFEDLCKSKKKAEEEQSRPLQLTLK